MPPRTLIPSSPVWKCPQCLGKSFSTSSRTKAVGPEHPKYIEIPEPPQQWVPNKKPVKGVLPVPRNVFAGTDKTRSDDELIAQSTPRPQKARTPLKGSREEWKAKMSDIRRQNLDEGIKSLRTRRLAEHKRLSQRSSAKQREREELVNRPEREDERLTAPSNNLDLDALYNKPVPDPTREQRILTKLQNLQEQAESKRVERAEALHTLYMNARDFIVTPQQLDVAVDEAFGSPDQPVVFTNSAGDPHGGKSIWARGKPESVQDMLNRANGVGTGRAFGDAAGQTERQAERIRRIAETLTGGKMETKVRE